MNYFYVLKYRNRFAGLNMIRHNDIMKTERGCSWKAGSYGIRLRLLEKDAPDSDRRSPETFQADSVKK